MITKFSRKRNDPSGVPYAKGSARIQVHADGSNTFKFTKKAVQSFGGFYFRPDGFSKYLRPDGVSTYNRP